MQLSDLQPAFPRRRKQKLTPFAVPEALQIPLTEIDCPEKLPRFFLLGERDDDSFRREKDGFTIDYLWPRFSETPVCRVHIGDGRASVDEFWDGESLGKSWGSGDTLEEALRYPFRVMALRDARRTGPDGLEPHEMDPRELFFEEWFQEHLGIAWHLPVHGVTQTVDMPGGIQRPLVIPCQESNALAELANAYCKQPSAYQVAGPDHLKYGSFSHRECDVTFHLTEGERKSDVYGESILCKIYVGPWRAVVELALFLQENGWDYDSGYRRQAFVTFPYRLVRKSVARQQIGRHRDMHVCYPPLLTPQDALGVEEGFLQPPSR